MTRTAWGPAALIALSLLVLIWTVQSLAIVPVFARPADEETRQLLEKSLSVVEIDKEIERVNRTKQELQLQSEQTEKKALLPKKKCAYSARRMQAVYFVPIIQASVMC